MKPFRIAQDDAGVWWLHQRRTVDGLVTETAVRCSSWVEARARKDARLAAARARAA